MKNPINYTIQILAVLLFSISAYSQKQKFDIIRYTPPGEWNKEEKQGVVNYTHFNATAGTFCVISIYASAPGGGDPNKDFKNAWNELVVTPFKGEANPSTESQSTIPGWKTIVGATSVVQDGVNVYIILTVFSGSDKVICVRTSLNDQSYVAQVDAVLGSIEIDRSTPTLNKPVTTPAAVRGKFGLMNYTVPAGWKEQQFTDGVVLKPVDLPEEETLSMHIMQPISAATLEQALAQSFAEATSMYNSSSMVQADGAYGKNDARTSFNGWQYIRGKGSVRSVNGKELGLELFVVKIAARYERIATLESRKNCGGVSSYFASDREIYRNAIEQLLYSLHFSDFNAAILKPGTASGGGITGVWQGTIQGTGAATGVNLQVFTPIFFSNGQVYFGPKFPTEGLHELNSRIPPELYPRNWGSYTYANGSGLLKMPFADIPFKIAGGKLIVTKNQRDWPFYKLNTVDGARFNGTYRMSESYGIHPVIQFTASGTFTDKGVIMVLYHNGNNCVNPAFKPGSGTYEVKDYTIIFSYTDGRKVRVAFLGTDYDKSNLSPSTLRMSFNDDPMTRD